MDPTVATAGMKRGRAAEEQHEFGDGVFTSSEFIKRRRNDTLLDGFKSFQPNILIPSIVMETPVIVTTGVETNNSEFRNPRFVRASTFPFRSPSEHFHHYSPQSLEAETSPSVSGSGSPVSLLSFPTSADNLDVEMNDDSVSVVDSQDPASPYQCWARPAKLDHKSLHVPLTENQCSGGRIPTPIYPHFAITMPPPTPKVTAVERTQDSTYLTLKPNVPNHHLPSPIIEIDAADEAMGNQLSRLTMESMDLDDSTQQRGLHTPEPSPTLSMKTGRARSGAITERRRIFMGYLEDCDKCKARTPGHLAHFLPG